MTQHAIADQRGYSEDVSSSVFTGAQLLASARTLQSFQNTSIAATDIPGMQIQFSLSRPSRVLLEFGGSYSNGAGFVAGTTNGAIILVNATTGLNVIRRISNVNVAGILGVEGSTDLSLAPGLWTFKLQSLSSVGTFTFASFSIASYEFEAYLRALLVG